MFSSDEEDEDQQQTETDFPLPPIPDDEKFTLNEAQQEPGGAPSHVNTSEYIPSTHSHSDSDGTVNRYKARLVALGFMQRIGIDCEDTYAPVSKYSTLRFLIAHCTAMNVSITHLDVTTAFLNADLEEEVWVSEPPCMVATPGFAFKLHKALYGLKEAPRAWAMKLKATMINI
jgi:hypothetical protein